MKWLPLAFVVLALAGCAEDPAEPETSTDPDDPNFAPAEMAVPEWSVGDVWEYQTNNGIIKLVVSADDGANYVLDTNRTSLAFFDEQNDISYIGPMTKSDLAGKQGSTIVQFFHFPLYEGKEWVTTWDGEQLSLVAHDNGDDTFHVGAYLDGELVNEYQYGNNSKFFDWIKFYDANGSIAYQMDLISFGSDWTGNLVRTNSVVVQDYNGAVGPATVSIGYSIGPEVGDLYLNLQFGCATGVYTMAIGPVQSIPSIVTNDPTSDGVSAQGPCPVDAQYRGVLGETPTEGTWGHEFTGLDSLGGTLWHRQFEYITL